MGDGSACRTLKAPGYLDERADAVRRGGRAGARRGGRRGRSRRSTPSWRTSSKAAGAPPGRCSRAPPRARAWRARCCTTTRRTGSATWSRPGRSGDAVARASRRPDAADGRGSVDARGRPVPRSSVRTPAAEVGGSGRRVAGVRRRRRPCARAGPWRPSPCPCRSGSCRCTCPWSSRRPSCAALSRPCSILSPCCCARSETLSLAGPSLAFRLSMRPMGHLPSRAHCGRPRRLAVGRLLGGLLLRDLDASAADGRACRRPSGSPRPSSASDDPPPSGSGGRRRRRHGEPRRPSTSESRAKTPISTPYVLVRAKSRVARCARCAAGRRREPASEPRNGQRPGLCRHVARSRTGPGVCETGAVKSAAPAPRVIAVVGPTAAGKSDLGVFLAQQLGGEVVNADSMQLYRGMDIGTAKLTPEERGGVPHHLLDIWDVTETASVAEYQRLARAEIDRLLAEGRYAGPGRRLRPVRPRGRRRPGVPRHRPRRPGPAGGRARRCAAPARCTPGSPPPTPRRRRRSCPATAAASSAPWRSSRSPASPSPPTSPATTPSTTPSRSASTWRGPSSTSASPAGSTGCGRPGSSTRCARWRRGGCARGAPPPARSATSRCSPRSPGSAPRTRRAPRPCAPPSASRAVRIPGSGATRGCTG